MSTTSLLPELDSPAIFTEAILRKYASFSALDASMDSRKPQLKSLAGMCGFDIYPLPPEVAETCESVASAIHDAGSADWNAFWREVAQLVKGDPSQLRGRRVLLGSDGQLHAATEECAIFFIPRRGTGEDDDILNDSAIVDIPVRLQPFVAFLHPEITLYDPENLRQQTPTRKFLDRTLVNRFRVQDIFSEVLIKRTPPLPARMKTPESELCADILHWGLSLLSNLIGRGQGDRTLRMLEQLALPCRGGWFIAGLTSFGPGWPESKLGNELSKYYSGARTADCREAAKRLLLPPSHSFWRGIGSRYIELLETVGVGSGIRLAAIDSTA